MHTRRHQAETKSERMQKERNGALQKTVQINSLAVGAAKECQIVSEYLFSTAQEYSSTSCPSLRISFDLYSPAVYMVFSAFIAFEDLELCHVISGGGTPEATHIRTTVLTLFLSDSIF